MKNSGTKKLLSILLVALMLLTSVPIAVVGAEEVYPKMQVFNAGSGADFHQAKYYKTVYSVTFLDAIDSAAIAGAVDSWDISANKDGSVMSWIYLNDEATLAAGANRYDVYIAGAGGVSAHEDTIYLFYLFESLKEVKGVEHLHTGEVKSFFGWFYGCTGLKSIDLSSLDTSSVTTLENMFARCYAIETVNLSGWNTSKVTRMKGVFDMSPPTGISPDYSLKHVDLTGWDTSNVTTMENMFRNCEALTELDLSSFNTSKVTTMRFMFYYCKNLKNIYVGNGWTTEAIANINDGIFNCCYALIGQTDNREENIEIYNEKHPSAYYPPASEYAKFREDGGYLDNAADKPTTPEYKVTYEFIGDIIPEGVTAPDLATYEEGTTVTVADTSSADHYIFSGWSTEDATVTDGEFTINNDVHFVGSWTKLYQVTYKYDESFELPEDAPEIPDVELWFAPGEDVPVYGIPYVYGYVFVGWNTEDADVVGDSFMMPENDVVFYGFYKIPVEGIEIIGGDITVDIGGDQVKVEVYVNPEYATFKGVVFESGDESIVEIDENGVLTPVGEGTTTIKITSVDDPAKTDTVTVTVKIPVTDITVDKTEIHLNKNETDKITVTEVKPDIATNKEVTFETSDNSVVTVDQDGNIVAVGDGTATITVTSKDNEDVKEVITVTVKTPVTEITATEDFTIEIDEEKNLGASVNDDATNKELIYETDNSSVIKVDNAGNVIAVGEGTATITITSKDNPAVKETVTVTVIIPAKDIIVDKSAIELTEGETDKISVTVTPDNATNKEVTYKSSDESVVKVDENGNIEAVGEGTATITVTSKDDNTIKETVTITVKKPVIDVEDIVVDKSEIELTEGETDKITVTVTPDNASNKDVTYKSSDESVVKVDENGNVEAVGEGTATITVTSKDDITKKETITVTVKASAEPEPDEPETPEYVIEVPESVTVMIGQKLNLGVSITPDDGTLKPVYASSNERVVKVDADGNILGIGAGTAEITVDFGNGYIRVIPVTVIALPIDSPKHYICFGKTDGIGWYEVSINGEDFFMQGPNSTLEVAEGSVLVIRVQDMWIDDEFDFYVNGDRIEVDAANTITVVVDGYMLIGALSMDTEVPDVEESLSLLEQIIQAIKNFFNWIANLFK